MTNNQRWSKYWMQMARCAAADGQMETYRECLKRAEEYSTGQWPDFDAFTAIMAAMDLPEPLKM